MKNRIRSYFALPHAEKEEEGKFWKDIWLILFLMIVTATLFSYLFSTYVIAKPVCDEEFNERGLSCRDLARYYHTKFVESDEARNMVLKSSYFYLETIDRLDKKLHACKL